MELEKVFLHQDLTNLDFDKLVLSWLETLSPSTKKNYLSGIRFLIRHKIIQQNSKIEHFLLMDHDDQLAKIKNLEKTKTGRIISEASKQARAACYISFTRFLHKLTKGKIPQAKPSRHFGEETFYKVRDVIKTRFLSKNEWTLFLSHLKNVSSREYVLGQLIVFGARKLGEVLAIETHHIDFAKNQISFLIKKRKNRFREVKVTYPSFVISQLKSYIGERSGFVFSTKNGRQPPLNQIYQAFLEAQKRAQLSTKVTPQVLRVSALVYLKKSGVPDENLMKIACLSSRESLLSYNLLENSTFSGSDMPTLFKI